MTDKPFIAFFSPANPGFYFKEDFGDNLPKDAVEITDDRYQELLSDLGKGWRLMAGAEGQPFTVAPAPPTAQAVADYLTRSIDIAADNARRVLAGDPLRAVEYDRVAAETQTFRDAGYPASAVPRSVTAWMFDGRTAQEAADGILREAEQYNDVIYALRERRLAGKYQVVTCLDAGDETQARQVAADTIAAIAATVANIGSVQS